MASSQSMHKLTKTDRAYVQMLKTKADKLRQHSQIARANNYDACSAYIQSHGVPYEDPKSGEPLLLYAVNGKAHVVGELGFEKLVALKPKQGPLYDSKQEICIVQSPEMEYMTGNSGDSGSGPVNTTAASSVHKPCGVSPPTNAQLKNLPPDMKPQVENEYSNYALYLPDRPLFAGCRSKPMHQLYLQMRIADEHGGSLEDAQALPIWNDTGSSVQVILRSDMDGLLGFRPGETAARRHTGFEREILSHTAGGLVNRLLIKALIRVCKDKDCKQPLRDVWEEVPVSVASDNDALRLSGNAMRKNLIFATPKGNSCLFVSPSRRAIAWQILRF